MLEQINVITQSLEQKAKDLLHPRPCRSWLTVRRHSVVA